MTVAEAFYAGLYGEVLGRTIDGRSFACADEDLEFVVGALAFVGRLEEARAVLASQRRWGDPGSLGHARARVASKFFLGVAYSRAGRHVEAEREFRENLRSAGRHEDPRCRFYVAQGLACLRYFRGRMVLATRHVKRALAHAIDARFQYGRLLATDLRGHALVQIGQVRAGLVLLERARDLARALDLPGNIGAIECSLAVYRARFGVSPLGKAIVELEALARASAAQDSYSNRGVETELVQQLALAGRSDEAWARLAALSAAPAPDGDGRARVRFLVGCAAVARLRHGPDSARAYVAEAREVIGDGHDLSLEVDVLCAELGLAAEDARREPLARLGALHALTGISRAEVYTAIFGAPTEPAAAMRVSEFEDDRLGARLARVWSSGQASLDDLLRDGYLGLFPLAVRASPEAAIVEVSPQTLAVVDRGNVRLLEDVPAGTARLLRDLALDEGEARPFRTKEQLMGEVWGLSRYRPDRHDPTVHTAISRLRALLGTAAHWIEHRDGAYRLAPTVAFRARGAPPAAVRAAPTLAPPAPAPAEGDADSREGAVLAHLRREGPCSTADVAGALKVSEMTALRTIRGLAARGLVVRQGKGPSTRYTAVKREEEKRGDA